MRDVFEEVFLCASTLDEATLDERIAATSQAGYDGLGLRPGHVTRALAAGRTDDEVRAQLEAAGLELFEIGFVADWWLPDGANEMSLAHEASLYSLADRFGARHMVVIGGPMDAGIDAVAERFAGLCRRAAEHGLDVALEFLPWTDTRTIEDAWRIVEASGEPNGGVVMDTWHFFRGGSTLSQLEAVPADRIPVIQVSDGPLAPVGTELEDTFHLRRVPGTGEFALREVFGTLAQMGVTAPIGVEVLSDELRTQSPEEVAQLTSAGVRSFIDSLS